MNPRKQQKQSRIVNHLSSNIRSQVKDRVYIDIGKQLGDPILDILKYGIIFPLWDRIVDQVYYKEVIK